MCGRLGTPALGRRRRVASRERPGGRAVVLAVGRFAGRSCRKHCRASGRTLHGRSRRRSGRPCRRRTKSVSAPPQKIWRALFCLHIEQRPSYWRARTLSLSPSFAFLCVCVCTAIALVAQAEITGGGVGKSRERALGALVRRCGWWTDEPRAGAEAIVAVGLRFPSELRLVR